MSDIFQERSDLDFLSDVLIDALQQKRTELVSDLFDLYNKTQNRSTVSNGNINIDKVATDTGTEYNFSLSSDYMPVAAGPVDFSSIGDDVISFGEYKSQEYRPE